MKNNNYFTVMGWMVNELNLSGNTLNVYALIYGFSQDGDSYFSGSLKYIGESVGITRRNAIRILTDLESKGLIFKQQTQTDNHFNHNTYKAVLLGSDKMSLGSDKIVEGGDKMSLGGSDKMSPNINIYNNNTIYISALDFLKTNHQKTYEDLMMKFKKDISDWEYFENSFNAVCDKEQLEYNVRALRGRFTGYATTWIYNANHNAKFKVIKNDVIISGPQMKRIG